MTQTSDHSESRAGLSEASGLSGVRLAVGLVQGLTLYFLYYSVETLDWPKAHPALLGALVLAAAGAPVAVLAAVGRIKPLAVVLWASLAALALGLLGAHDVGRQIAENARPPILTFTTVAFSAAALFIAHHLITPAVRERRWIVDYPLYFDCAWKAGVQLALSLGFTGALWILLRLGGSLFSMIGLSFVQDLLDEEWFSIPITALAFAIAVQLTDVRDGLIQGVRSVALMLLSWLLVVITLIVAGFLIALPFTGLDGLWETRSATRLVLTAAAGLIILINTAYQDGSSLNLPPKLLRAVARLACFLIAPLIVLAIWALALRIGQYGLTPERVIGAACAVVGAAYALGYALAGVSRTNWLKPIEHTNVGAAVLSVTLILSILSPLADPARLSVNDQLRRLTSGAVTAEDFDYEFLRFDSGQAGYKALQGLTTSSNPQIAAAAKAQIARRHRYPSLIDSPADAREAQDRLRKALKPVDGQSIPLDFLDQIGRFEVILRPCRSFESGCTVRLKDLTNDGQDEVLAMIVRDVYVFQRDVRGRWNDVGRYSTCSADLTNALKSKDGVVDTSPADLPDLVVEGVKLRGRPENSCPEPVADGRPEPDVPVSEG